MDRAVTRHEVPVRRARPTPIEYRRWSEEIGEWPDALLLSWIDPAFLRAWRWWHCRVIWSLIIRLCCLCPTHNIWSLMSTTLFVFPCHLIGIIMSPKFDIGL